MLSYGWKPPWRTPQPHWGHLLFAQLPRHLSLLLELSAPVTPWLSAFLEAWQEQVRSKGVQYQASFLYVVLSSDPSGSVPAVPSGGPVDETGFGTHPAAPEDWVERDLLALIEDAIRLLTAKT
jgi:hypothetical protein